MPARCRKAVSAEETIRTLGWEGKAMVTRDMRGSDTSARTLSYADLRVFVVLDASFSMRAADARPRELLHEAIWQLGEAEPDRDGWRFRVRYMLRVRYMHRMTSGYVYERLAKSGAGAGKMHAGELLGSYLHDWESSCTNPAFGVRREQLPASCAPSSVVSFLGAARAGKTLFPVNPSYGADQQRSLMTVPNAGEPASGQAHTRCTAFIQSGTACRGPRHWSKKRVSPRVLSAGRAHVAGQRWCAASASVFRLRSGRDAGSPIADSLLTRVEAGCLGSGGMRITPSGLSAGSRCRSSEYGRPRRVLGRGGQGPGSAYSYRSPNVSLLRRGSDHSSVVLA